MHDAAAPGADARTRRQPGHGRGPASIADARPNAAESADSGAAFSDAEIMQSCRSARLRVIPPAVAARPVIARDSMPPAVLMAGPAGVGKRLTAIAIAQAVNCLQPQSSSEFERDACGECASCRRIARGVHPDVIVVEPGETGAIKIEQLRDVIDRSQYRPFEGRRRVVIINEADAGGRAMRRARCSRRWRSRRPHRSSSSISSIPDALLPTVLSRCPRLRFGPLTAAEVARALKQDHGYPKVTPAPPRLMPTGASAVRSNRSPTT